MLRYILTFLAGAFFGGLVSMMILAACIISGEDDEDEECPMQRLQR